MSCSSPRKSRVLTVPRCADRGISQQETQPRRNRGTVPRSPRAPDFPGRDEACFDPPTEKADRRSSQLRWSSPKLLVPYRPSIAKLWPWDDAPTSAPGPVFWTSSESWGTRVLVPGKHGFDSPTGYPRRWTWGPSPGPARRYRKTRGGPNGICHPLRRSSPRRRETSSGVISLDCARDLDCRR
jgi:hypothetical protein